MKKITTLMLATLAATALTTTDAAAAKKGKKHKKAAHAVECPAAVSSPETAAAAAAAPVALNASEEARVSGFFVGGSVGAANTRVASNFSSAGLATETQAFKTAPNSVSPLFGLFAGYNFQFNKFVLGLEGHVSHDTKKASVWMDDSSGANLPNTWVKKGISYGAALRLGAMVNSSTNIYAKLGLDRVKYTLQVEPNRYMISKTMQNFNKTKFVFVPGVGFETFMNSNLFARMEYNYVMPVKLSYSGSTSLFDFGTTNVAVSNNPTTSTHSVSQHLLKVSVGYKF
jgi:opacity protein-like surface antigen